MKMIETKNLTKNFRNKIAVDHINMEVNEGEIFGFLGPNGAGKTTTINLLLRISYPTSGSIKIFGKELAEDDLVIKKDIGYMPQGSPLYTEMTGSSFLDFCARFYPAQDVNLKESLAELFKLPLHKRIRTYSGGMRQQLLLIQALQHKPKLLILDEPTSGLDPIAREQFYQLIKGFRDKGVTVFFSTHILTEVDQICDTVCIIKEGGIVETQKLDLLKSKFNRYLDVAFQEEIPEEILHIAGVKNVIRRNNQKYTIVIESNESDIISYIKTLPISSFSIKDIGLDQLFLEYFPEQLEPNEERT